MFASGSVPCTLITVYADIKPMYKTSILLAVHGGLNCLHNESAAEVVLSSAAAGSVREDIGRGGETQVSFKRTKRRAQQSVSKTTPSAPDIRFASW